MAQLNPSMDSLMEREQGLIDALLLRFKNIIELAAVPDDPGIEVAASQSYQMNVETTALIRAAEELLSLSRELKEMWLVGRLRELGQGEEEGKIDGDAKMVGELVEKAIALRNAHGGGEN